MFKPFSAQFAIGGLAASLLMGEPETAWPQAAPPPQQQGCSEGSYDRNGNWVPSPNCYGDEPQYNPQPGYSSPGYSQPPPQQYRR